MGEIEQIYFKSRAAWREWLKKNHIEKSKVAVIRYKKHTGKPSPNHLELMHEAICFGWIDTTVKRLDEEKYLINFSRRNAKSKWSDNTLGYARSLIRQKLMFPQGLKFYKEGLKKETHDHGIPKNPEMPQELKEAFLVEAKASSEFDKLAPSYKRTVFRWILRAKRPETRQKRVEKIVEVSKSGKKIF